MGGSPRPSHSGLGHRAPSVRATRVQVLVALAVVTAVASYVLLARSPKIRLHGDALLAARARQAHLWHRPSRHATDTATPPHAQAPPFPCPRPHGVASQAHPSLPFSLRPPVQRPNAR